MYILYLDESGTGSDTSYFVLAGLAVFEREIYWYAQDVDTIQKNYLPDIDYAVEFHASPLRQRESDRVPEPFNSLTFEQRRQLIKDMYQIIRNRRGVLFGVAIEKAWCVNEEPYERAFEDLTSRFDLFLRRINATAGEHEQRGIIAVAESSYRRNLEVLGERFRGGSTRWGQLRTISDVPFFLPPKNTRLLQLADFCANAIFGRYNSGLSSDFDIIAPRFDRDETRIHGLAHLTRDHECQCPACISRQAPMF
jgi:hypothetical protein